MEGMKEARERKEEDRKMIKVKVNENKRMEKRTMMGK